jgi:hypothetical protein
MDYYEKALLNHIMPTLSQNQNSATAQIRIDYQTTMSTSSTRNHSLYAEMSCCHGTGLEFHNKYQEAVYYKTSDGKGLYVNLYMPTTLNWAEKGFEIVQENDYLNEGAAKITVNGNGPLDIMLRVPYWVERGFEVKVNGKVEIEDAPRSTYVTLSRNWKSGDVIEISMPFSVRVERQPQNLTETTGVLFYGPYYMVQSNPSTTRTTISGLNLNDLDEGVTIGTNANVTHTFGNYSSFSVIHNGQTYIPKYTRTTTSATYRANYTIPRNNDLVAVNRSVVGEGALRLRVNNRDADNTSATGYANVYSNGRINRGSTAMFYATADEGYYLYGWRINGMDARNKDAGGLYAITGMNSDTDVTAVFARPITSLRINGIAIETVKRGQTRQFSVALNDGALSDRIVWSTANPALATVDSNGVVTVKNVIGTVVLTATDPDHGKTHSVLLRIAS